MMEDITLQSRMRDWKHESLCPGFRARQFEYNPHYPELMVCGTLRGEVVVVDHTKNKVLAADLAMTEDFRDSILGLCWLHRTDHNMFVTGTSKGILKLCKIWTSSSGSSSTTSSSSYSSNISNEAYSIRSSAYKKFEDLTSVHVNCSDDRLLVSGYSNNAEVYDLESKQIVRTYKDIHKDHINISRFANLSPHVFGTSSFDKTVKVWDLRDNSKKPIYTCRSDAGHVMLCFSPDDLYLLTSAIDNEVRQYLTVDGKLQANLKIPQTGHPENYTRAYYMNNGDHIISGSSEEQTIRIHCAHTGSLIHSAQM
jgi:WD40 repeat protein